VSDAEMETVRLERNRFHGDWNYVIKPATQHEVVDTIIY
jgi:hypothetical protein